MSWWNPFSWGQQQQQPQQQSQPQQGSVNPYAPPYPYSPTPAQATQLAQQGEVGPWANPASYGAALNTAYGSGGPSGGGGGGGSVTEMRSQVSPLIQQMNDLYNQLNSGLTSFAQDARDTYDKQFQTEQTNAANNYGTAQDQTNAGFTGRGIFDSSYRGNANQANTNAYTQGLQQLQQGYNDQLANLGGIVAKARQSIGNAPQFDLSQYTDLPSLQSLHSALQSHIDNLKQQQQSFLTPSQLRSQLDQTAPANNATANLKSTLDKLVASNAAPEALTGLANNYINMSGLPQSQKTNWLSYFSNLLNGAKAPTGV